MRSSFVGLLAMIFVGAGLLAGWGCAGSGPARFFLLSSQPGMEAEPFEAEGDKGPSLVILPVRFPQYLDRPQVVTRTNRNEIQLAEFHRWAEPLKVNFTRVLAENLSRLLRSDGVVLFPAPRSVEVRTLLSLEVLQFDGALGGESRLIARWVVYGGDGKTVVKTGRSEVVERADSPTFDALVIAQSRAVAALSRDIAQSLAGM